MRPPLPRAVRRGLARAERRISPVWWANLGPLTRRLGRASPLKPPVLVLSLPRSGSSWIGATLGDARNALYLREPVTQPFLDRSPPGTRSVFEVDPVHVPPAYRRPAEAAFRALPVFPRQVVPHPAQWDLASRHRRRLVVKEVNPLALAWFLRAFRPRVIYVARHPAAVALSFHRMGWAGGQFEARFSRERLAADPFGHGRFTGSFWAEHGAFQAVTLGLARDLLAPYPDHRIVHYEAICADPVGTFRELFRFAGLAWDARVERGVVERSRGKPPGPDDPYGTRRDSRAMAEAWRHDLPADAARQVRDAYLAYGLPDYPAGAW